MPVNVDHYVRVTPAGLGAIEMTWSRPITATDDVSIDIQAGAADVPVVVQPGAAAAIEFIYLSSPADAQGLSYRTAPGAAAAIPFAGVHLYSGPGMAGLLGANPTTLYFTNTGVNPVALRILVGRNA